MAQAWRIQASSLSSHGYLLLLHYTYFQGSYYSCSCVHNCSVDREKNMWYAVGTQLVDKCILVEKIPSYSSTGVVPHAHYLKLQGLPTTRSMASPRNKLAGIMPPLDGAAPLPCEAACLGSGGRSAVIVLKRQCPTWRCNCPRAGWNLKYLPHASARVRATALQAHIEQTRENTTSAAVVVHSIY